MFKEYLEIKPNNMLAKEELNKLYENQEYDER